MKVTLIQLNSGPDKEANIRQVSEWIEQAVKQDQTELIALPEIFNFVGGSYEQKRTIAEPLASTSVTYHALQSLACKHNIIIHGGSICEQDGKHFYNTTVVFNRDGSELARYRKIHLFDAATADGLSYCESSFYKPGHQVVSYSVNDITFGCAICYDLRFSELFLQLIKHSARVIILPAAFANSTGKAHWEILLRARAIETQCYIIAPAQTGDYQDNNVTKTYWGHSMIVDPWGTVLVDMQNHIGFKTVEVDFNFQQPIRERMPVHQHRKLS